MTDVEIKVLANPKLQAMMDPHDLKMLRQRAVLENRAFTDLLSPDIRNDYLAFVRMTVGIDVGITYGSFQSWSKIDLTDARLVARYLSSPNLGLWSSKEFNERRRYNGGRTYPLTRTRIDEEEIETMSNHAVLHEPKPTPEAAVEANQRFAETTRQASFALTLGIREIRLLAAQPWKTTRWLQAEYTAGLQRLIEKGLLIHEIGAPPWLSEAGELVRRMLILSRHIVERSADELQGS
jgi:hypothetical protein